MDLTLAVSVAGPCVIGVVLTYLSQTGSRISRLERSLELHENQEGHPELTTRVTNLSNKISNNRDFIQRNRNALESFFKATGRVEKHIMLNIARQNKRIGAIEKQVFTESSKQILMLDEPDTRPILSEEIGKDTSSFLENSNIFNEENKA